MKHIQTLADRLNGKIEHSLLAINLAADMSMQYYGKPLIITYSGGKDSDVLAHLAVKSGAQVEFLNSHTTVDAPETVYHIHKRFKQLRGLGYKAEVKMPDTTMWKLIVQRRMPPTRIVRYCCDVLKESTTPNRLVATGVRGGESSSRSKRNEFEVRKKGKGNGQGYTYEHADEVYKEAQELDEVWDCKLIASAKKRADLIVNPIFKWTDHDVWEYIRRNNIDYNPLYDRGYWRVGCIGCPMSNYKGRVKEFSDYPKYKEAYIRAFQRMIDKRKADGLKTQWTRGEECFDWWLESPDIPGQISISDYLKGDDE